MPSGLFSPHACWQPGEEKKQQSDNHRKATLKEASASPFVAFLGEGPHNPVPLPGPTKAALTARCMLDIGGEARQIPEQS